jgi:hypothetical protein
MTVRRTAIAAALPQILLGSVFLFAGGSAFFVSPPPQRGSPERSTRHSFNRTGRSLPLSHN